MAGAVVGFLLENVKNLLVEKKELIYGAEKELEKLTNHLELMKAFLRYWARMEKNDVFVAYENQIREAVYKAEDTIDICLTARSKSSHFNPKIWNLAKKVAELNPELDSLFKQAMNDFPLRKDGSVNGVKRLDDKLRKPQQLREDNIVGFEDEEATIMKYLKQTTQEIDVISIVGMPGLGKTTLAWKIYRDPEIKYYFPILIWVYISQEFNVRDLFLNILKKFPQNDMSSKNNEELKDLVKIHLNKGKVLLFLDDVWTIEDWKQIEDALPKDNKEMKIMITSRDKNVACQANRNRDPHMLRFLNFNESWKLLRLEVFGKYKSCPEELEDLGKQIARECGGVPLAIVVIAGILVEKGENWKYFWKKVSESVNSYALYDKQKRTENIINLSYNKLPHNMRECFLYFGMFREDSEIPSCKLTRLWIAEGFIEQQPNLGLSVEEVAKDYLNELLARNLVMLEKTKANGEVRTCRVHDMIREFCLNEASYNKNNLFQEVKKRDGVFHPPTSEIGKHRRLSIHSNVEEFVQRKPPEGPGVRSFLCFSEETINLPEDFNSSIPEAFKLLRVIDVNSIKFAKFPLKLTKLIHLRYIALSSEVFKALPKSLSELENLQTVTITTTSREFEIKTDIGDMMQLRHLKTKSAIRLKEVKGGGGENLRTLSRLSVKCCKEELFIRVPNLKNMGIRGDLNNMNSNCLDKLNHLEKLKLVHDVFPQPFDDCVLNCLPKFPRNLRILTLSSTHLDWMHMATLRSLRNLEVLKLKEMAFKGVLWESEEGEFPSLETLYVSRSDLEKWTASGNPFPHLKNLVLKKCKELQEIPTVLWERLQLLEMERVNVELVKYAKKMGEEKQKLQEENGVQTGGFKLKISPGDLASASTSSSSN